MLQIGHADEFLQLRCCQTKMKEDIGDYMLIVVHGWDIARAVWAGMRGAFLARRGDQFFL